LRLLNGIHLVTGPIGGNIYMLKVKNNFILIDTGLPRNDSYIFKYLGKFGRDPDALDLVVLTHCHIDHTGSAAAVVEKSKAKVCAHVNELDHVEGRKELPLPSVKGLRKISASYSLRPGRYKAVRVEHQLEDTQMVGPLETIHLPGHTPGSIGLYYEEYDMLFCGDAMTTFNDNLLGPPEEFEVDRKAAGESARKIAELAPLYLCPGHGPVLKVEDDSLWDIFCDDMGVKRDKPAKKKEKSAILEKAETDIMKGKSGRIKRREKKRYRYKCMECRQEFEVSAFKIWRSTDISKKNKNGKSESKQLMECPYCQKMTQVNKIEDK
jgi:glyoxylase-like metal-dependent hydrolase (beta-lactamase superfamily II)